MKPLFLFCSLVLAGSVPALAAPGQEPRQAPPHQTHKGDYWLSRDMQRLAFWQPRDSAPENGTPAER